MCVCVCVPLCVCVSQNFQNSHSSQKSQSSKIPGLSRLSRLSRLPRIPRIPRISRIPRFSEFSGTSASREDCWARRLSRPGCLVLTLRRATHSLPSQGHGCAVGIDKGPTRVILPPRQGGGGTKAPVLTYVVARGGGCARGRVCCWWFFGEVLSGFRTPARTMSLALSFDLGPPRDSTFSNHGSEFVESASSSTFSLCETLGRIEDSSIVLAFSLVSLVSHVSENPQAPSLHLWVTPPGTSGHTGSRRETC